MIVGCVSEIKPHEYRVGIVPGGAADLVRAGHKVLIDKDAGHGSGFTDAVPARRVRHAPRGPGLLHLLPFRR